MNTQRQNKDDKTGCHGQSVSVQPSSPRWPQKIGLGIFLLFLTGIFNRLGDGLFGICASVIMDTSSGFWRKFIDIYYASAATADPMDDVISLGNSFLLSLLILVWMLISRIRRWIKDIKKKLEMESQSFDFSKEAQNSVSSTDLNSNIKELERRLNKVCRSFKLARITCWIMTVIGVYVITLSMISYGLLKQGRLNIIRVRPFISELEYHQLNRQWVMMKSKADYLAFKQQIEEYNQRAEMDEADGESRAP